MASLSKALLHSVELSAVSLTPHEHVEFTWTVQNFKALLERAISELNDYCSDNIVASLPFNLRETLFPPGTPKVSMAWVIEVSKNNNDDSDEEDDDEKNSNEDDNTDDNGDEVKKSEKETIKEIRVYLQKDEPSKLSTKLYAECSVSLFKDKQFTQLVESFASDELRQNSGPLHFLGYFWGCHIFDGPQVNEYLDSEGSLNLKVTADFYVDSDGIAQILPQQGEDSNENDQSEVESRKMREDILLKKVASLLGDELTSDVILSIQDKEKRDVEIGKFFCHSAILSGRSSVMREMLETLKSSPDCEKRDGKVVLKLEVEDVAVEVIDIFLNFLYSGTLKDVREHFRSIDPTWVAMLPKLIDLADKYEVVDLMDLCDVHLHRVVTRDNVLDLLALANRHDLKRTLAKLQTKFSKDADLLLHSIYR